MYVEVTRYLLGTYTSQRLSKYLNEQLFAVLIITILFSETIFAINYMFEVHIV